MSTVTPHSELLRRAVTFVNETRLDRPEQPLAAVIDEAAMRCNLSPLEGETLHRLFTREKAEADGKG